MAVVKKDVFLYLLVLVCLVSVAGAVVPEASVFEVGSRSVSVVGSHEKLGEKSITLAIPKPQVKEVTARNGQPYAQISLEGCGNDNTVGFAALPIITHAVEVPWDTKVTAQVIRRHFEEFSVKRRLYPHQPPIPKVPGPAGNPPFQLNEEFYSGRKSDSFKTAGPADKVDVYTYRKRGRQYAKLAVRPFEYNPAKGLVRYCTELELKVTYARELPKAAGPRAGVISVVEVTVAERRELGELIKAGYNISNVRGNVVTIYATLEELGSLKAMGLEPVVIERQGPGIPKQTPPGARGLGVYHDYATLTAELQAYAADYNDVCRLSSLGTSVQGRQLWAMKITDNPDVEEDEPEFKYVATMHGDEPVGTEMCLYFVDLLLTYYGADANITELVDSTEIWVVPLVNPDGLELGTRFNAAGIDLNRAFPEGSSSDYMNILTGPYNNTAGRPREVAHVMRWSQAGRFVLSANFHTGALVVNYPYDNDGLGSVDSPTPDDLLFEDVARRYSYYNPPMWSSAVFADGITNGAAWYTVSGGMQDWNYRYVSDNEVTIELCDVEIPPEAFLAQLWDDNRESMLSYLEAVHMGIRGVVTDSFSSEPLWAVIRVEGNEHPVFSDPNVGDYHSMLLPGTYNLVVTAPGYKKACLEAVTVVDGAATRVDVALEPAQGTIIAVTHQTLAGGAAEYVAQKQDEGYDVHLITLSGSPTAADVRNQIRGLYATTYADFVVIIGDVEQVPTFYSGGDASDLPYALMDAGEGFEDYLGKEMVVGRISLDTNAEISEYVSKLASFVESERHNDFAWISGGSSEWQNEVCEQTHDWVIEYCIPSEAHSQLFYHDVGSAGALTNYINNGTDAVVYSGHGSTSGWSRYNYGLSNLQQMTNTNDTPIVFGHCCLTASFGIDNCFAENWIRTAARGIVYIGGSDSTYWIEDDVMEKAEFWAMYMNREVSIAHAVDYGLERVHDMNPSSAQYYYTIYQVIGDPTVGLFTAGCPELGRLELDRTAYSCSATIQIQLRDCSTPDPVTVDINSTSEPTGETVVLSESPSDSGKFVGSIEVDAGAPTADGRIQVSHNDTLVVTYSDPNDGEGDTAVVQKTAVVDCVAPTISDVTAGGWVRTVVTFETDEPACGAVRYGLSCGSLVNTAGGLCSQTSHSIELTGLDSNTTYFYVVDAEDAAGNLSTDTNDGNCYTFTTPAVPDDYFTQLFDLGDNDLDNLSIMFTPDGSINFYSVCVEPISVLPTHPRGSKRVPLSDDSYRLLPPLVTVWLYGHSYGAGGEGGVYVGSNGYITFGAGDSDYTESLSNHFRLPRISALFDDLNPSTKGAVGVKKLAGRVAVTWGLVPEYSTANSNTSQIEMFFDGRIRISWLGIDAADGLAGLSQGLGVPPRFTESDLSGYGPCDRSAAQP